MLAMLDEECLRPGRATDMTFLDKLTATCERHAHFESRGCRKTQSDRSLPHDAFRLLHYAGEVGGATIQAPKPQTLNPDPELRVTRAL